MFWTRGAMSLRGQREKPEGSTGGRGMGAEGWRQSRRVGLNVHSRQEEETRWWWGRTRGLGFKPRTEAETQC